MAVAGVVWLAVRPDVGAARDSDPLAADSMAALLGLEEPTSAGSGASAGAK